jgi:Xaa-Pro aminopeptidase
MTIAISPDRYPVRRDRLRRRLRLLQKLPLLVTNPVHVRYLTGFTGDDSYLLVLPDREIMISDFRYRQQLQEECPGIERVIRPTAITVIEATGRQITKLRLGRVGYEAPSLSAWNLEQLSTRLPRVEWISTQGLVEQLRQIKDRDEIQLIQGAIALAADAFRTVCEGLVPDQTERQLATELEYRIRCLGGEGCSFAPIVAVGRRAALPHASPSMGRTGTGSFVLFDWGARYNGYVSDLTRMVTIGKISARFRKIHDIVLRAQRAAIAKIRAGAVLADVDAAARAVIDRAGFGKYFGHALGHGIGLEVHEAPRLGPKQNGTLRAGMVVTVEPGIYLPGWGGVRIEDNVLVTRNGSKILSACPTT